MFINLLFEPREKLGKCALGEVFSVLHTEFKSVFPQFLCSLTFVVFQLNRKGEMMLHVNPENKNHYYVGKKLGDIGA
jgi:hypothetical protein